MYFFFLCGLAIITLYFFSYALLGERRSSRAKTALIPALIGTAVFVWLIIEENYTAVALILYGIAAVVATAYSIASFRKKRIGIPIIVLVPMLISLYIFWGFVKSTYLNPDPCLIEEGCMNETGMIMVLSFFLMALSFLTATAFHLAETYQARKNKKSS